MCPSLKTAQERSDTDSLMDDQTAGVDNTHVGVPVSGGQARDGLTACRPPVSSGLLSEPSPLSSLWVGPGSGSSRLGMTLSTLLNLLPNLAYSYIHQLIFIDNAI